MTPFPHLLKLSRTPTQTFVHIVSDTTPMKDEIIALDKLGGPGYAADGKVLKGRVIKVHEERKARGDWSKSDYWPDFYLTEIQIQ